jgi:hypothetical protein
MLRRVSLLAGATLLSLGIAQAAQAGTLHNGWNYAIDSFSDGSGGDVYDIEGLAFKATSDFIYISVTGGTPLAGERYGGAADGNIGWGDLLFNFTGNDIHTASTENSLWGIRFAATNDSGVDQVGVYSHVSAQAVAAQNAGYSSLNQYYNAGWNRTNTMGDLATKQDAKDYFGANQALLNVIDTGHFLGGIEFLTDQEAANQGLDFAHFNTTASQTHTFRFDRSFMPSGHFLASVFLECANDGTVLEGELANVPEPSSVVGLTLLGLMFGQKLRRKTAAT